MNLEFQVPKSKLNIIDQQVSKIINSSRNLIDISNGSKIAVLINLNTHADVIANICMQWPTIVRPQAVEALESIVNLVSHWNPLLFNANLAQLSLFASEISQFTSTLQDTKIQINKYNAQVTSSVVDLNDDVRDIDAQLKADQQKIASINDEIKKFNEEQHSVSHIFEEIGKGIISLGIWTAVDADNAQKEASRLGGENDEMNRDIDLLNRSSYPLSDLLQSLNLLESDILNTLTAVEEVCNKLKTLIQARQELPSADDPFYQDSVNEVIDDLTQLGNQVNYILQK